MESIGSYIRSYAGHRKVTVLFALHTFGTCKELEKILYSAQVMNNCFPEDFLYVKLCQGIIYALDVCWCMCFCFVRV